MRIALIVEYEGTGYSGLQYQAQCTLDTGGAGKSNRAADGRERPGLRGGAHRRGSPRQGPGGFVPDGVPAHAGDVPAGPQSLPARADRGAGGVTGSVKASTRAGTLCRGCMRIPSTVSPTRAPLLRRTALRVGGPLELDRMRRGARLFEGAHDFAQFSGPLPEPGASTVRRIIGTSVRGCGNIVTIEIEGNAFLPHMVRRMARALVALGSGKMSMDDIRAMIDRRPRAPAGHALPAHGLSLEQVKYAGFPPEDGEQDGDN